MPQRRTILTGIAGLAAVSASPAWQQSNDRPAAAPPPKDIFQAASDGDIPAATELAMWNPAIARLRSPDGRTPLHYAAAGGQTAMISFLTLQGADLSAGPESPLLTAVSFPDPSVALDMARALLVNGSDPNAERIDGRTALEIALARGSSEIAALLVHRGAEGRGVDAILAPRVYFGRRYSYRASGEAYVAPDLDGLPQSFINEFVRLSHGDGPRVKHLLKLAPSLIAGRATWDEMGIEAAAHMGLRSLAAFLADQGAPVSTCTATLLGLSARVKALLTEAPACARECGAHDLPLVAYAAYADEQAEIADQLLRAGADVRARAFGMTVLHLAAAKGYTQLAETLLAHGADLNARAMSKGVEVTPLGAALAARQQKTADFLKAKGGTA